MFAAFCQVQVELSPGQLSELVQLHGASGLRLPTGFLNKNRFLKTNKQWVLLEHWGLDDRLFKLEPYGIGRANPNLNVRRIEAALSEAGISAYLGVLAWDFHATIDFSEVLDDILTWHQWVGNHSSLDGLPPSSEHRSHRSSRTLLLHRKLLHGTYMSIQYHLPHGYLDHPKIRMFRDDILRDANFVPFVMSLRGKWPGENQSWESWTNILISCIPREGAELAAMVQFNVEVGCSWSWMKGSKLESRFPMDALFYRSFSPTQLFWEVFCSISSP